MFDSTDGDCRVARSLFGLYTSGGLSVEERTLVGRHLDACGPCAAALAEDEALRRLVRRAVRGEAVPESLGRRVRDLIRGTGAEKSL